MGMKWEIFWDQREKRCNGRGLNGVGAALFLRGKGKGCHSRAHGESVPCFLRAAASPGKKDGEAIPISHWDNTCYLSLNNGGRVFLLQAEKGQKSPWG